MMRPLFSMILLAVLAGCGADGPPLPPKPKTASTPPGLSVSGQVEIGLSGGF